MRDWYRAHHDPDPTRTVYVDVPTADLEKYRVSNITEQSGRRSVKSYSRDPENEFFLPKDLTTQAKSLGVIGRIAQACYDSPQYARYAPAQDDDRGMSR